MPDGTTPSGITDPSGVPSGTTPPPGSIPGPGQIDPTNPGGVGPGGVPLPGMPGGPGGPGTPGAPKTVTVQDGNRTITMTQPDARGRSQVTIDDGETEPKTYDVDFTNEPGEQVEEGVLRADENGRVTIPHGDAKIVLEQVPGPTDQVKMTVDDGTPTTYDVDFGPDSEAPGRPGGPGGVGVPDVPSPASMGGGGGGGGADLGGGGGGGAGGGIGGGGGGGIGATGAGDVGAPGGPGTSVGAQNPENAADVRAPVPASAGAGGGPGGAPGGAPMGGMPMGGAGGGGQGGDQTRQSKWRTQGQLFDDADPAANFSGVVGKDPAAVADKKR
jgi:hypothetical protein